MSKQIDFSNCKSEGADLDIDVKDFQCMSEIFGKLLDIYKRKNHDYGNSFDKSLNKRGLVAALVRMEDKFNRLDSLITKETCEVVDESLIDTCLDLANYAAMTAKYLILNKHKL